jgi:hypothetical protein
MIALKNRKRLSQLVRMLSSGHQGEAMAARDAVQKICSFNDLADLIESGSDFKKAELQFVYDSGHEDGFKKGFEKGLQEGKLGSNSSRPPPSSHKKGDIFFDIGDKPDIIKEKIQFCQKHKDRLRKDREKEFIANIVNWTTVLNRPLTPGQENWLNDIYARLGGK